MSHDAVHAQMDVKLRSLICLGLNEQVSLLVFFHQDTIKKFIRGGERKLGRIICGKEV